MIGFPNRATPAWLNISWEGAFPPVPDPLNFPIFTIYLQGFDCEMISSLYSIGYGNLITHWRGRKMKKVSRIVLAVFAVLVMLSLAAFAPMPASASPALAVTRTPRAGQKTGQELSFALQREQNAFERQQLHLTQAGQVATKTQNLIDKAQAKGLDVTALNSALTTFKTELASAQASHDQAGGILSAKNGFDSSSQVTDATAAHQTLVDARDALRQAHLTLQGAVLNLRVAIQNWRVQNKQK
jgi:hypothetical protein